ncbi:MAG: LamG-like jellyroll fold domain-containing protein [Flavobacteriia bacterium]
MKKPVISALLSLFSLSVFAQIPNYVPSNGLVGWWPFNGNANDESGNGNHGTSGSGISLTTDRFLISNSAYDFNGSGNISLTLLPTTGSQDFTISGWIKTNDVTVRKGIACWGQDNPWNSTYFNITANGYLKFDFAFNGGPQSPIFIADNNWHSVIVTCTSGLVQLYLDGTVTGTALSMSPNITGSNKALGANIDNSGSNNFIGTLDDIGIWNRALTQCEIQDLYHAQLGSQAISAGADQSICSGDPVTLNGSGGSAYQWNNNVQDGQAFTPSQSANYVLNGTDSLGCSGMDTVVVTVLETAASTLTQTALDSYTLNGQTYTQSGTYTQTLTAANGCDSTITLNLTLNFTGIDELGTGTKKLVKITDLNGKIIPRRKNTLMLFIYEDGTVERVLEMD